MFEFLKKKKPVTPYDRDKKIPVIRSSICTGEQVAGYRDDKTGRFTEVALIRDETDLQAFLKEYGFDRTQVKREW